ncbi:dTDP-glucose 4,6-dehydratase [bacterium]|nr:dTDP-glucose 4,6-dehydratase [bacterium]MBU3954902.1 dTDP-glucose 4,6-dehydratase [bacterium]MBU4134650.1 dTDP-glucose 4,6-dehydratase [bacterium]
MKKKYKKLLVTGGAGFIGSEFVRQNAGKYKIAVVDKLTYAGDIKRLAEVAGKYSFYKTDICDEREIDSVFKKEKPDAVVHFAAESHVDRSIDNAGPFMTTNIIGTQVLLDAAKKHKVKKFCHVSTDEVYGDIIKGKFTETSPFSPNSPYAVSKAAADMLVSAYHRTYGLPVVIMRASNNYGPWQFPEKLIPVIIKNALENKSVPVYAKGLNVREWLYVADCAKAVAVILEQGEDGQAYNTGSGMEKKNIDVVKGILAQLGKSAKLIKFVKDRPGHDIRYALDISKIRKKLLWKPVADFKEGLKKTVEWYVQNTKWTESVLTKK